MFYGGLLGVVHLVLFVIALLEILNKRWDGAKTLVWILVILLLPLIGVILWFLVGRNS
jgi:hypothetical protein